MLYQPNRHEPMLEIPWDERLVRKTISEIVADTLAAFDIGRFWPTHPREDGTGLQKGIWNGAAGAIWGLDYLHREAGTSMLPGAADALDRLYTLSNAENDPSGYLRGSFLMGPVGILLVKYRVSREPSDADRLFALLDAKIEAHTDELMWGTPGVVLAASFMWDLTREDRWRDLYLARGMDLWSRWKFSGQCDCYVWHQRLYQPQPQVYLGSVHGLAGNLAVLLRGADLLDEPMRRELYERAVNAIVKTAMVEAGLANWLPVASEPTPGVVFPSLMQWCHGAPGTLASLSAIPKDFDPRFEQLFLAGAELTWRAGPVAKGPNLCHGTAGNGYLLMKAWTRTGDDRWLHRARSFAMYSIAQYQAQRRRYGCGWYTLWTGDIGTAIYLWHCIAGQADFPTMGTF